MERLQAYKFQLQPQVEQVSWDDAQDSSGGGIRRKGTTRYYRLPTEAEWEYEALAGTGSAYSFGDDLGFRVALSPG